MDPLRPHMLKSPAQVVQSQLVVFKRGLKLGTCEDLGFDTIAQPWPYTRPEERWRYSDRFDALSRCLPYDPAPPPAG